MPINMPLSNILEQCFISHYYDKNSCVVINLQLMKDGQHLADIRYRPKTLAVTTHLIKRSAYKYVFQNFDLTLSWMKAYAKGLENKNIEYFPAEYMANS